MLVKRIAEAVAVLACCAAAGEAAAAQIDLNAFVADPTVIVAADGSSADFTEDAASFTVLLTNDPGLGDLEVIIAGVGQILSFSYSFTEPAGNDDEFFAFIIDASTGLSAGAAFEFSTQATGAGTVSFDLTSLVGTQLGFQFQLNSLPGDADLTSTLNVSNLDISAVPEPGTWSLLLVGGALLAWRRRAARPRVTS